MIPIPKVKLAFGLFLLLAQLIVYFAADAIYGPYAAIVKTVMMAYFILMALFSPLVLEVLKKIGPQDIPAFAVGFIPTALFMLILGLAGFSLTGEIEKDLTLSLGFGFLHSFVKAFDEEVIFRGVLPKLMGGTRAAGIVSSLFFGLFHVGVLLMLPEGVTLFMIVTSMVFLSVLGFVWYLIFKRFGLMGSTGSHFAYNFMLLRR
jgi:membrane protease YdiL (CAAX protease family)